MSSRSLFRNALFRSNCLKSQPKCATQVRTTRIVVTLTIGLKVQCNPSHVFASIPEQPNETYICQCYQEPRFLFYKALAPNNLLIKRSRNQSHVLFLIKALYSTGIESFHSGNLIASCQYLGFQGTKVEIVYALA